MIVTTANKRRTYIFIVEHIQTLNGANKYQKSEMMKKKIAKLFFFDQIK